VTRDASSFSRRAVLRAGLGGVLAVPLAAMAGCTEDAAPKAPDQLAALATQARQDVADANAIAGAVPDLADAANAIAKGRTAHATALQAEVDRMSPPPSGSKPPAAAATDVPQSASAAKKKLQTALTKGQQQAAGLVASVSRNRAGLLGSVSAGCASMRELIS
jgi:hypothetical protein